MNDLVNIYEALRAHILQCPNCGLLQRGNGLRLIDKSTAKGDWFDDFKQTENEVMNVEQQYASDVSKLKAVALKEASEKTATIIKEQLLEEYQQFDPRDIYPIMNYGVGGDAIVYDGLASGDLKNVHIVDPVKEYTNVSWKTVIIHDGEVMIK
ncbi:MAG: hypothetical protein K8823_1540 [Cenarchaeum symbiont of Oopsacas minuta]|nr:hypothetical protein [Cenarchaeum symbiont of Oopsacas minuta]